MKIVRKRTLYEIECKRNKLWFNILYGMNEWKGSLYRRSAVEYWTKEWTVLTDKYSQRHLVAQTPWGNLFVNMIRGKIV